MHNSKLHANQRTHGGAVCCPASALWRFAGRPNHTAAVSTRVIRHNNMGPSGRSLHMVGSLSRCASNMSCTMVRCNRYGVWAPAPAPNSEADFLLLHRVLSTGQGGQDLDQGARNPPLARPAAQNATPPAHLIDQARARRPPPTSHARLALHPRPLPTGAGIGPRTQDAGAGEACPTQP